MMQRINHNNEQVGQTVLDAFRSKFAVSAPGRSRRGARQRCDRAEGWLTIVSIALIPVTTAAIVETIVNARLAMALGRLKEPMDNHVVVVGLGDVGTGVIRQLHMRGVPVVAIDKTEAARGAQLARELDVPLVIGDASREETLRAASVRDLPGSRRVVHR
jgi:threonine dehydrogenase-like Zn-dependent dehydrogenase